MASAAYAGTQETAVSHFVRNVSDGTNASAPGSADWVVGIETSGEEPIVSAIALLARDATEMPSLDTEQLIRARRNNDAGKKRPDDTDLEFARKWGKPLYIVGTWKKPAVIWEISVEDGSVKWRTIGRDGSLGDWEALAQ